MARIQFGWTVPNRPPASHTNKEFLHVVDRGMQIAAEQCDSIWVVDHLQSETTPMLESWTELTYLAALYPQFHYGHAVLCQSFRNPALLAKMAATFQYLSAGRFILGIGAGWKEDEYLAYGYDFPSPGTRVEELEETLQIIHALWHQPQATVTGKHYHVTNAYCEPKPDPIPTLMIGGRQPRMMRLVARYADWWNVSYVSTEDYRHDIQTCEQTCAEVGRDPATLRRTWFGSCLCAPTEAGVQELIAGRPLPPNVFVGTPAQVIEQIQAFLDLGVDYFMLSAGGFPALTSLEMLVREVIPAVNR